MITGNDFYGVMSAMVPLYFAMFVAFASVRYWKVFTPEQCSGVNRFVATFAVPVLSFHFISQNDPYSMNVRFILADSLSKAFVLLLLSLWAAASRTHGLDWLITIFSIATLPNTLVMGIPLLRAMYGAFTQSLMVQLVVLQCIVWYTMLLFLFEYRAATLLIKGQFPGQSAASISKIEVDGDVISLDGRDPVLAESETDPNGQIRVRLRRSTSTASKSLTLLSSPATSTTPRPSNFSGAEIYSINTPGRVGTGYASPEGYSLQQTPRGSNFNELDLIGTPIWGRSPAVTVAGGKVIGRQQSPSVKVVWECNEGSGEDSRSKSHDIGVKELSFRSTSKFIEYDDDEEEGRVQLMPGAFIMLRLILTMVGRKLARNPNTYSSILGLLWSLISCKWGLDMPILVKNSIKIISDAGLGMAMFSLGLFMALQPKIISCGMKMGSLSMAIRFIGGPAIMSAASMVIRLKGAHLHTAIVQAALPQGIVPFVFAREYGLHPDILSTGVIFGMLVSLPVTLLYYIFLGL